MERWRYFPALRVHEPWNCNVWSWCRLDSLLFAHCSMSYCCWIGYYPLRHMTATQGPACSKFYITILLCPFWLYSVTLAWRNRLDSPVATRLDITKTTHCSHVMLAVVTTPAVWAVLALSCQLLSHEKKSSVCVFVGSNHLIGHVKKCDLSQWEYCHRCKFCTFFTFQHPDIFNAGLLSHWDTWTEQSHLYCRSNTCGFHMTN